MIFEKFIYDHVTVFDLIVVILVFISAIIISKIIGLYVRRVLKDKFRQNNIEILIKIIKYCIFTIAIVYTLTTLGVNLSGLMVAGGVAGVILGFASQNIIGNIISGIFLIIERPIKIGDQVNINNYAGYVEDIRIISTTIRTYDGLYIRIPNQNVFASNIINYVNHIVRRFEYSVGIRYSDDAGKAIDIVKEVIHRHPFALENPEPQVFVDSLGDNAVIILVRIWSPITEWYAVKMELLWKIKKALEDGGIQIAFPQRVVWLANERGKREIHDSLPDAKKEDLIEM